MKAILLEEPRRFRNIQIPEPAAPGPGQALVAVHRVGICGTDIAGFLGKMPFFSYPRIPGHELGVGVLAVGEGVDHVAPGDRCAVEPYMNCGDCFACRAGATNCCEKLEVLGVMTDGGMRQRLLLRADKLHKSDTLAFDQLALVETLSIGCHAIDRVAPTDADTVLVIGAGPIGLSAIEFARLTGARVIVMDLAANRLEFCRDTMGVHATLQPGKDTEQTAAHLRELLGGELPRIVVDATGNARSMGDALAFAAHTGRVVYVGITTQDVSFPDPLLHRRELTLFASRNSLPRDFRRIIGLIESGDIDTRPWITHRAAFDDLAERFERLTSPQTGAIKAIVELS